MSKLDDIFETLRFTVLNRQVKQGEWQSEVWLEVTDKPKQQIKDLMLELIGKNEIRPESGPRRNGIEQGLRRARNSVRNDLRKKVEEL